MRACLLATELAHRAGLDDARQGEVYYATLLRFAGARTAAERLTAGAATVVYRAGVLHDLGRVAVPTGIWDRPGPLRPEEWELVRLHPYHTARVLARSPVLAPLGQIAGRHHERTDGSGYPAGVRASELDTAACLLAAADVLQATWNHRNDDRLGGIHRGSDGIMAFMAESAQLTGGTLRVVPQTFMADGEGRVSVLVQVTGTRPDGRSFDNPQIVLFTLDGDRVRTVDQFVGDPAAVAAFWA